MKAIKINNKEDYKKAEQLLIEKGYKIDTEWNNYILEDMEDNPHQHYLHIEMIEPGSGLHNHKGFIKEVYENIEDFLASEE